MNSPPSEPSQAAAGAPPPHPHASNPSSMPHAAHPSQPHFAPSPLHGSSHPHYPAQYYHGSYFDSFARPRRWWWGGWSSSLPQVPPPPPPPVMPPPGAAPRLPPHPSLPYEPYHQQRIYRTCYRRSRGPRLFPILAFGAIVFFATKHHYMRREQDRERFMRSVVQDGSTPPTSSSPSHWDRRAPGPWHWGHDRDRECHRARAEPAKTTTGATAVGEEARQQQQQAHDEMWAEQWAKAMGRVPPAEKQQRGAGAEGEKWV